MLSIALDEMMTLVIVGVDVVWVDDDSDNGGDVVGLVWEDNRNC